MWRCGRCGATVEEDDFERCWSCGRSRDGGVAEWTHPERPREDAAPRGKIRVVAALREAVLTVIRHPIVLLAALPSMVWNFGAAVAGMRELTHLASESELSARGVLLALPRDGVFEALTGGLSLALMQGALRGQPSIADALRVLGGRLPRLFVLALLLSAPFALALLPEARMPIVAVLFPVVIYAVFRSIFAPPAIVVDDVPMVESLRRSWQLTRGNFWRTVALVVPFGPCFALATLLGDEAQVLVGLLLAPVLNGVALVAYLQRRADSSAVPAIPAALGPAPSPTT